MSTCCVPSTALSTLSILSSSRMTTVLRESYSDYHPHFPDETAEAQRGCHLCKVTQLGSGPGGN